MLDKKAFMKDLITVLNGEVVDDFRTDEYNIVLEVKRVEEDTYLFVKTETHYGSDGVAILKEKQPILSQSFEGIEDEDEWDITGKEQGFRLYRYGCEFDYPHQITNAIQKRWPDLFETVELPSLTLAVTSFVTNE